MILHPRPQGFVAILQSAHAFLAFQIAEHWGNRLTPRPAPRPEVLAAVLLHDAGWDGREAPRLDAERRPLAFDTIPEGEHEAIWASSVERTAVCGRYARYLVSHHVSSLAAMGTGERYRDFLAGQEALREQLRSDLASDSRYRAALGAGTDEVNRAVVRFADALAVYLSRGTEDDALFPGLPRRGGSAPLSVRKVAERTYRLRPWPLVGRRLDLTTEGVQLPSSEFPDDASLRAAWEQAPIVRITWTLLAQGTPAD
ncbi:MAG: DUF3891 family protein [Thermoanaerobaculaceae bacterium]|jgi:hypothetical protein